MTTVMNSSNCKIGNDDAKEVENVIEDHTTVSTSLPLVHQEGDSVLVRDNLEIDDTGSTKSSNSSKGGRWMNPQDATLQSEHCIVDVNSDRNSNNIMVDEATTIINSPIFSDASVDKQQMLRHAANTNTAATKVRRKTRKRPRTVVVSVNNNGPVEGLPLPSNQYECILVRRAILSVVPGKTYSPDLLQDRNGYSVYGDIALGMKLSIADTGQVIVQRIAPLSDGRASPAQLTGVIQRGDILLAIDGVSLTDNTLAGLKPLQAPDDPTVPCQRRYKLRLAAGEGLDILRSIESQQATADARSNVHIANEMLGLFPMVDQLSGMPLFEEPHQLEFDNRISSTTPESSPIIGPVEPPLSKIKPILQLDSHISEKLATQRDNDRHRYFYNESDIFEQKTLIPAFEKSNLSLPERQELGRKAVVGVLNLMKQVENVDAGNDIRSFQSWNTTLSLYSRASVRRRRVFDAASLPSKNFGRVIEENEEKECDDGDSTGTGKSSANSDQIDGDELLLRLAAHDEIWRKQVIEFLKNVATEAENIKHSDNDPNDESAKDIDTALSKELGNFLFGESMSKILTNNKTPRSLPSQEVTAVLFDLATKLSVSVPDEIKASGTIISYKSGLTPFKEMKRNASNNSMSLASRFLLDHALPAWLKSFRPISWEHRRILWPVDRVLSGGSMASSLSEDDGLTVDTSNISLHSTTTRHHRRKKSIQEIIEDQELDIETRGEACFLVTFFFIHSLMPKLMDPENYNTASECLDEIISFMKEYGAYLRMDTCLVYASVLKAHSVIDTLLNIAKHDPRHREVVKQLSKSNAMVFYEPSMLSAVLQLLHGIYSEATNERKQTILDLCATSYPDIRPWQVQRACSRVTTDGKNDLYYKYLSQLLHPLDGHDMARNDNLLVKEWCELSVSYIVNAPNDSSVQRTNFLAVASRTSSYHLVYNRDLLFLLSQSMIVKEYGLSLDLISEILDNGALCEQLNSLDEVINSLQHVATCALGDHNIPSSVQLLRRVIRLYSKPSLRKSIDVPSELLRLVEHKAGNAATTLTSNPNVLEFMEFLITEASPYDLLQTLALKIKPQMYEPELIPLLNKILVQGVASSNELSGSLLRIKKTREKLENSTDVIQIADHVEEELTTRTVWSRMGTGLIPIYK